MQFNRLKRREFITLLGGAEVTCSLTARAQQPEQMRKIGVLMNFPSNDEEGQARIKMFAQALQKLGWSEGGNVRTHTRWAADDVDRYRRYAEELVALTPDVILASGSPSVEALLRVTRSVPIVFANVTGFTAYEYSISGKWLELLKEFA